MGYSSVDIPVGFSMFTPQFESVDTAKSFTLADITVCNADGVELDDDEAGVCRNDIYVQKLTDGKLIAGDQMSYTTAKYADRETNPNKWGWNLNRDVPLANGEGIIVNNDNGVVRKFRTSGGVVLKPVTDIPVGFSIFGNNTPIDYKLGDIMVCNTDGVELDDDEAGVCRNDIYVQKLTDGKLIAGDQMSYTTAKYADRETNPNKWGWNLNRDVDFKAGEALIVNNDNGVTRKFKLPDTIKKETK